MRTPFVLLLLSLACVGAAYQTYGPVVELPIVVSVLSSVAAFLLVVKTAIWPPKREIVLPAPTDAPRVLRKPIAPPTAVVVSQPRAIPEPEFIPEPVPVSAAKPKRRRGLLPKRPNVVIDGSNAMYWNGDVPRLGTLREVVKGAKKKGYQPGIIFDANAGYKLCDRYLDDRDFAKLLGLPGDRVLVVGKGEPADPTILAAARELDAKVITNDRFRDWAGEFPEVTMEGHLMSGGYRDGVLWLDEAAYSDDRSQPNACAA